MKKLFKINAAFVILTALLYCTLYLGMLFSMVLGTAQVLMSIYLLQYLNIIKKTTKLLFLIYAVFTIAVLAQIVSNNYLFDKLIVWFMLPSVLALFHLYITYRIKIQNSRMSK